MREELPSYAEERLRIDLPRFCFDPPNPANGLRLREGTWKFGFDTMSVAAIREHVERDVRPRWSSEVFPGFADFRVLELGPQDGFITAGLEAFGVGSILSIEANVDSYLRCLILKNTLDLRATYLLGNFLTYLDQPEASADLIYASGVLYHLEDPVGFIKRCSEVAPHLYLWTFYYDQDTVQAHHYESRCFLSTSKRILEQAEFTYHRRLYQPEHRAEATYAGGIEPSANWMTLADIERALDIAGFEIKRTVADDYSGIQAMNIWASRRDAVVVRARAEAGWSVERITDATYRARFVTLPDIIAEWTSERGGLAGRHVLDLGCGEGTTALAIALRDPAPSRVVGLESSAAIDRCGPLAKAQLGLAQLPGNLELYQTASGQLDDEAARFDIIYSWSFFEHVERALLPVMMRRLRAALRPGGQLFIQVAPLFYSANGSHLLDWVPEPWAHLVHEHAAYIGKLRAACPGETEFAGLRAMYEGLNRLTAPELIDLAERAGLRLVRQHRTSCEGPVPPSLVEVFQQDALMTEQIVLLLHAD